MRDEAAVIVPGGRSVGEQPKREEVVVFVCALQKQIL